MSFIQVIAKNWQFRKVLLYMQKKKIEFFELFTRQKIIQRLFAITDRTFKICQTINGNYSLTPNE